MDLATVIGLVVAIGGILVGQVLEGGHISSIVQPTAALIVLGGTIGAVMVNYPMDVFLTAVKRTKLVFSRKKPDLAKLIEEIVAFATEARKNGIIALEQSAQKASEPFLTKAILMAVDGTDSKRMRDNLELVIGREEEEGEHVAKVYESAGGYAPTIGIIGAVLGLIHVMSNLADVAAVGSGIAVAFVATIYGVATANIFFLPAAGKLKLVAREQIVVKELVLEGVLAIQEGMNPKLVRDKLTAFLHDHGKKGAEAAGGAPAAAPARA
jgi:chemotaxis protein MotA